MVWTAPKTWLGGSTLTAAELNEQVRDNLLALGGPWQPYAPAWTASGTNPVIGDGVLRGWFSQAGTLVHFAIEVIPDGSTTMGSGVYRLALPAPAARTGAYWPTGQAGLVDASASGPGARRIRTAILVGTTVALVDADGVEWAAGAPFPLAAGDSIRVTGTYEAG